MSNPTLDELMAEMTKTIGRFNGFADTANKKQAELQARLLELEQRAARADQYGGGGGYVGGDGGEHALRALLEGSAELQAMAARKGKRAVLEMPAGYFNPKAQITSTGIAMPDQRPGIVAPSQRRLTIRQLIPGVPTDGGSITYLQETGFDNQAATVSETDTKPSSNIEFALQTAAVVTLAHWIRVSTQALSDIPTLQQYIDTRLRYGLAYVEETQLLSGSGVGNNLSGLLTEATAYGGPGGTKIDVLREAINELALNDFSASGIIVHPTDWKSICLAKDSEGRYLIGDPASSTTPMLWGLPVIPTAAISFDSFLVADFPAAALLFDREDARVDISTETDDDFVRNMAHVRAESRLALAILRPGALITGDFGTS